MPFKKRKSSHLAHRQPKEKCQEDRDNDDDASTEDESIPEDGPRTSLSATAYADGLSSARQHCRSVESDSLLPLSSNINSNNLLSQFGMIQTPPSEGTSEQTPDVPPQVKGTRPPPPSELGDCTDDKSHYSCLFRAYLQLSVVGLCAYMPLTMISNLVEEHNFNTSVISSINTALHLVTMPLLGYLGENLGGNYILTISLASSTFSYGLLLLPFQASFYLSRVLSSATHSLFGSQLLVMEKTCPKHRATAFSVVILSYGLGMIAGLVCGAVLSTVLSYRQLFGLTALLSFGNLAYFFKNTKPTGRLPTSLGTSQSGQGGQGAVATTWLDMIGLSGSHSVQSLLVCRLLLLLPMAIFHQSFQGMFSMHRGWTAVITYTLNIVSLTSPIFALTKLRRHFTGSLLTSDLTHLFNWLMAVYLVLAVSWWLHLDLGLLVAMFFPLTVIVSCLCVAVSADVTVVAPPGTAASALAVSHLMQLLVNWASLPLPPSLACLVGVLCSVLARRNLLRHDIVIKAGWQYVCGLCEEAKPAEAAAAKASYPNPIESKFITNGGATARNVVDETCFSDNE